MATSPEGYKDKVQELRTAFTDKFADKIQDGSFDSRDVETLNSKDQYVENYLTANKGDINKCLVHMEKVLTWRKGSSINDLTKESIPQEVWDRNGLYYKGKTTNGNKILYFSVKSHVKNAALDPEVKKLIAFQFNEHYKEHPDEKIVVVFDMAGAGVSNMDLEVTKFIITCFSELYPRILEYMLMFEMPFILNAIWTIIKGWLSDDQKTYIRMVKKKDIRNHIAEEDLWPHMKD